MLLAIYIPLIVVAALGAALLHGQPDARPTTTSGRCGTSTRDVHTWVISLLYIGTFGSFIGFGFAFGQVLQVQFKADFSTPVKAAYLTFLGPLLGSLIRPVGGALADRIGGAKVTLLELRRDGASAPRWCWRRRGQKSLPLFLIGFIALFVFSGIGNGSAYKMIPAIFRAKARR